MVCRFCFSWEPSAPEAATLLQTRTESKMADIFGQSPHPVTTSAPLRHREAAPGRRGKGPPSAARSRPTRTLPPLSRVVLAATALGNGLGKRFNYLRGACPRWDCLRLTRRETRSTGQNNYHSWNCYRDNEHQLFNDGTHRCWSIYYCLGVSLSWAEDNLRMSC
jgi:hypothetical protein